MATRSNELFIALPENSGQQELWQGERERQKAKIAGLKDSRLVTVYDFERNVFASM